MSSLKLTISLFGLLTLSYKGFSQNSDSNRSFTLDQCIEYALQHQPALKQSYLNQSITKATNGINLSGWLPQANITGNLLHYDQLPTSFVSNTANPGGPPVPTKTGVINTAIPQLSVSQALFSPQLIYAARSAPLYTTAAAQSTDSSKITLYTVVSKAFYNLLLTLQQIDVLKEDTTRLGRNVMDTYHQYVGGIVDETDYDEAVITLNNSKAQLKQQTENISPQYAVLKQYMGYPPYQQFDVSFDTSTMLQDISFDTTQQMEFEHRIEFQQLKTTQKLQHELTGYYKLSFLPTLSFNYNYFYEFENNKFSSLFSNSYPYSYVGVGINFPIFSGFSKYKYVHRSKLQEEILGLAEDNLKSGIYTQYTTALANYKGNLYSWELLKENVDKAKNVYRIVSLQYKQGTVAYLNMIVAESNLIAAETGYINSLYQLLSTKIDLEQAMGLIPYKH